MNTPGDPPERPATGGAPDDAAAVPITRSGFVTLIGRPNVGKSTLLNRLVGQKVSITSRRPQTTRHRLLGIRNADGVQAVYVDTPGINPRGARVLGRHLNRTAQGALEGVDLILFLVQGTHWTDADQFVYDRVCATAAPALAVINKVDLVQPRSAVLPVLQRLSALGRFAEVVPVSARTGSNVETLARVVGRYLPEGGELYPQDQLTDRGQDFMASEVVREKLMRRLGDELPYACAVGIEALEHADGRTDISAVIWVERPAHKAIVIGKGGAMLKAIGSEARADLERMWGSHVMLRLWVKVRVNWSEDEAAMRLLGYGDG